MPTTNPTRPYYLPGFRIALVREPGVKLAERPQIRVPAEAAPMLAQYIGETDREVFVIAMLTVRHRVLGKIALTGQTDSHAPQSMHSSGWMKPRRSSHL